MLLNEYLNIQHYNAPQSEYKISFKDEERFYRDVKNEDRVVWWFGDGYNECDIELANIVAGFVRPHLPPYAKLILKTIYLKYQRQERPTLDCRSSLLASYIKQFDYDFIEVPYLHGKYTDNVLIHRNKIYIDDLDLVVVLPDAGARKIVGHSAYYELREKNNNPIIICQKERNSHRIVTKMPSLETKSKKFAIIDDIIAGGDSIINVIEAIRRECPNAQIDVYCIFLMSAYGYNNIRTKCGHNIDIHPMFDLRRKLDNPSNIFHNEIDAEFIEKITIN